MGANPSRTRTINYVTEKKWITQRYHSDILTHIANEFHGHEPRFEVDSHLSYLQSRYNNLNYQSFKKTRRVACKIKHLKRAKSRNGWLVTWSRKLTLREDKGNTTFSPRIATKEKAFRNNIFFWKVQLSCPQGERRVHHSLYSEVEGHQRMSNKNTTDREWDKHKVIILEH